MQEQGVRTRAGKKERKESPLEREKKMGSPSSSNDTVEKQRNGKRKRNHHVNSEQVYCYYLLKHLTYCFIVYCFNLLF